MFCISEHNSSFIFIGCDRPMSPNRLIKTKPNPTKNISVSRINTKIVEKNNQIAKLKKDKETHSIEIARLWKELKAKKLKNFKKKKLNKIKRLKDFVLNSRVSKSVSVSNIKSSEIKILDSTGIHKYERLYEISEGGGCSAFKVGEPNLTFLNCLYMILEEKRMFSEMS